MPLRFTFVLFSTLFLPLLSFAEPNEDKKVAFSSDLVECYASTAENGPYFIMPTKLAINRSRFTGKSSFAWRDLQGGKSQVNLVVQLFTGDELQLQALKQINAETKRKVKFKAIDIRNASLKLNEPPELVSSQDFSSLGGSTFSRFQLKLILTKDGADAWKESILNGDNIITTGRMAFEARFTNDSGQTLWKPYDLALEIGGLPDPSQPRSDEAAIIALGKLEGEKYFWGQYANCGAFVDATTFVSPSESELQSSAESMSASEKKLFVDTAQTEFESAMERQRVACEGEIQKIKGEKWIKSYFATEGIDCIQKDLPKWNAILPLIDSETDAFKQGAQAYYDQFKKEVCDKKPVIQSVTVTLKDGSVQFVDVQFSEPVKRDTLKGNLIVYPAGHPELFFADVAIDKFQGDFVRFHFNGSISKASKYNTVEIKAGIITVRGLPLFESVTKEIEYP
jgi:hypothetical protein